MIICDENIDVRQVELLRSRRLHVKQVGDDIARKGFDDRRIIPLLHSHRRSTFVTWDRGFYRRDLCHSRYCIVQLDVPQKQIAARLLRFLRDRRFATKSLRCGKVIRISQHALRYWQMNSAKERVLQF